MNDKTTHFGFQQVAESEKAGKVRGVFSSVAGSYDVMNDLMSFGLHRLWKAFTVQIAGVRKGDRVLDVAGGTADLSLAFAKKVGPTGQVWLTDINHAMLSAAATGSSTTACCCRWPSATPRSCPSPTTTSTWSRWPSACAT
jgi:demethylmenaquinone methyltransferase/2-methoxy-6-polyprenyl-1,4-benzoquinol methylase